MAKFDTTLRFFDSAKQPIHEFVIPGGTTDISTSLVFHGLGYSLFTYGEDYDANLLHLLENFANISEPPNPVEGQLWFDSTHDVLNVARVLVPYQPPVEADDPFPPIDEVPEVLEWVQLTGPIYRETEPLSTGQLWYDETQSQLKYHNGIEWLSVAEHYLLLTGGTVTGNTSTVGDINIQSTTNMQLVDVTNDLLLQDGLKLSTGSGISSDVSANSTYLDYSSVGLPGTTLQNSLSLQSAGKIVLHTNANGANGSAEFTAVDGDTSTTLFAISDTLATASIPLNFNGNKINNVAAPSVGTDAARKTELDSLITSLANKVEVAGDTMTGSLIVSQQVNLQSDTTSIDADVAGCSGIEWKVADNPSTDYYVRMKTTPGKLSFQRQSSSSFNNTTEANIDSRSPIQFTTGTVTVRNPNTNNTAYITDLKDPIVNTDAANKRYVGDQLTAAEATLDAIAFTGPKAFVQLKGITASSISVGAVFNATATLWGATPGRFRIRFNSANQYTPPPTWGSGTSVLDNIKVCLMTSTVGDKGTTTINQSLDQDTYNIINLELESFNYTNPALTYFDAVFRVVQYYNKGYSLALTTPGFNKRDYTTTGDINIAAYW